MGKRLEETYMPSEGIQIDYHYMKRWLISLIIRKKCKSKPQSIITLYLLEWLLSKNKNPKRRSVGSDVETLKPLYIGGGHVKWWCSYDKKSMEIP